MSIPTESRKDRTRRSALNHFSKAEHRDTVQRQEREKSQAADAAKTAKLRALRLAKEAADKDAAARAPAEVARAPKDMAKPVRKRATPK